MAYIGNPLQTATFLTDTFNGDNNTVAFTLQIAPASASSIIIAVDGVLQEPTTYGLNGTTLTFSEAPPTGTNNISIRYLGVPANVIDNTAYRTVTEFTALASQTTFTVPSYTVNYVNVFLNGVMLGAADYTATSGTTVVLATGATVGDLVTVESFRIESVVQPVNEGQYLDSQAVHVVQYNAQTLTTDVTVPSNRNAYSAGPIEIEVGRTMTIEDGGVWIIL
jgi:hypothetical protein